MQPTIDTKLGNPNFSGVTTDNSYASGTATVKPPAIEVTNQTPAPLNAPTFNPAQPIPSSVLSSGFTIQDVLGERKRLADELAKSQIASQREQELAQRIKDIETGSTTAQLGLEGQGRGITQDILSKQGAAIQRRETIAKLPLVNELNTLVSQRSSQIDAVKSQLDLTSQNLNILTELQKMTQPDVIGSPTVDKVSGNVFVYTRNPQTGQITQSVVGRVSPETTKEYVQTGTYTNAQNQRVLYGVTPGGRIEQQVLGGEQMPASVIAAQTRAVAPAARGGAVSSVEDAVSAVLGGTATLEDFSIANNFRGQVASSLAKKRNELKNSGDTVGYLRASAGGKPVSDTALQSLNKGYGVLNQVAGLATDIQDIDTGPVVGAFRGKNPWDTNATVIKARLNSIIPNLARGIYGEVGVLTDNDIRIYRDTLPNLTTPEAAVPALMYITVDRIRKSYEDSLKTQAAGGRDVSGFVPIYEQMTETANNILAQINPQGQGSKPALNSFMSGTTQSTTNKPPLSSFFR